MVHSRRGIIARVPFSIVCLFVVALLLRTWGIDFGLPHLYHTDEWRLVMPAIRMLHTGDLNPHEFLYGSLQRYMLAGVYDLYFLYGRMRGFFTTVRDIPIYDAEHIRDVYAYPYPGVYVTGRMLTAVLGALTVVIVYFVGCRLTSQRGGLIAAVLLTVFPRHVVDSHFTTPDVPVTLFMLSSYFFAFRVLKRGALRDYILAGFLAGLAASTKYPGATIIIALIAAHFLRPQRQGDGPKLLASLLAGALGFVVGTPFALLDFKTWLHSLDQARKLYDLSGAKAEGSSARWYLRFLLKPPNFFITLPAILGLVGMLRDGRRAGWSIATFLMLYYGLFSLQDARAGRVLVPLTPFLALLAGYFIVGSSAWIRQRLFPQANESWIAAIITLFIIAAPFYAAASHAYRFTQKDVRTLAREWIVRNLPPQTKIAIDGVSPVLPPGRYQVDRIWSILSHDVDWYQAQGYKYVVLTEISRRYPSRTVEEEARYTAFLRDERLSLAAEIEGPWASYPGIDIWIYRVKPNTLGGTWWTAPLPLRNFSSYAGRASSEGGMNQ